MNIVNLFVKFVEIVKKESNIIYETNQYLMVDPKTILDKLEKGEAISDEEMKELGQQLLSSVEGLPEFDLNTVQERTGMNESAVLRLFALVCAKDEFKDSKGCTMFNDYIYKPKRGRGRSSSSSKKESEKASDDMITQRLGPDYQDREFLTGGLNFDTLGRAYTLSRNMVFHPSIQFLYDILKRTKIMIRKDNGEEVEISLLNYSIGAEPDRDIGFMSWVNTVVLKYYESMGIEPVVLLVKFKEVVPMLLAQENLQMQPLPDYLKINNVYVKVRGSRTGHVKVAMESGVEEANVNE